MDTVFVTDTFELIDTVIKLDTVLVVPSRIISEVNSATGLTTSDSINLLTAGFSAFVGALFAFLVSQLVNSTLRNRKRWVNHWNALCGVETYLNETMAINAGNMQIADNVISAKMDFEQRIPIVWQEPHELPRDNTHLAGLQSMELKNRIFVLNEKIRRLNNDNRDVVYAYSQMRGVFFGGNLSERQYVQALGEFRNGLKTMVKAYSFVESRVEEMMVFLRASMDKNKHINNGMFLRMPNHLEPIEADLLFAQQQVKSDIEKVRVRSRAEIKDLMDY